MQVSLAQEFGAWLEEALQRLSVHRDVQISIVTMLGKSSFGSASTKCDILNDALDKQVFLSAWFRKEHDLKLEAYYDPETQCLFLHLVGLHDLNVVQYAMEKAQGDTDFYKTISSLEEKHCRMMLFLLLFSHIVVVLDPCCRFDLHYARLFRTINNIREQTQDVVCEILKKTQSVSKDWAANGRFCSPRILFAFHRNPLRTDLGVMKRKELSKKLSQNMEDQIYQIFRKSRVITNDSSQSVCSVPANDSFVYIFGLTEAPRDPLKDLLEEMHKINDKTGDTSTDSADRSVSSRKGEFGGDFYDFLMKHINDAHKDGFDDNVGKGQPPAYFELPKLKAFVRAASAVYSTLVLEGDKCPALNELPQLINVELEFSESRCQKVLPLALRMYEQDLPDYYPRAQHQLKLAQAMQVLSAQSRGPMLNESLEKLRNKCEQMWRDGRQACETSSLTANNCSNQMHVVPLEPIPTPSLPVLEHCSKARYLSTCSCGHRQELRPDPFDIKEANLDFYERPEFSCCRNLEKYNFPTFEPSSPDVRSTVEKEIDTGSEVKEEPMLDVKLLYNFPTFEPSSPDVRSTVEKEIDTGSEVKEEPMLDVKLLERLRITTQSQEDYRSAGASTGGDFLPDRDNKFVDLTGLGTPDQSLDVQPQIESTSEQPAVCTQPEEKGDSGGSGSDIVADLLDDEEFLTHKDSDENSGEEHRPGSRRKLAHKADSVSSESEEENEGAGELLTETQPETQNTSTQDSRIRDTYRRLLTITNEDKYLGQYLPGMPHNQTPAGLDPLYPSWSLLCIGPSSIYTHAHGLRDQPNFTHGSNFLLPWDVNLRVDLDKWQTRMDVLMAGAPSFGFRTRKPINKDADGSVSVKIFIGFEYECPRGHRFMLQTPEKMLKHSGPGGPKEGASTLVASDLPFYFTCSCRAQPRVCAQLQRVHVITPKAPVSVTLNPRIVPQPMPSGHSTVIFHPGTRGLIQLSWAKYYVLRLPYAYVGPDGPFYPPKEPTTAGRVLKGMFGVIESEV